MGLTFTVGSFVTPISAFASSSGGSLEDMISQTTGKEDPIISTRYISNTEILSKLRTINPTAYDSIPADVLTAAYQQDFLRQGTTKIVKTSTGFKLYLNSAIVKSIKYAGYGAATAAAAAVAAAISAAIFGGLTTLIALTLSALFPKVSITILVIWLIVFIIGVSKISNSTPKN